MPNDRTRGSATGISKMSRGPGSLLNTLFMLSCNSLSYKSMYHEPGFEVTAHK